MNTYLENVNAGIFYLLVAIALTFIVVMCIIFLVKSYRTGIAIGMDKKILKKTITASATFTLLPSISILLGVIALSGTLGVPFSWLRLSVIGALQYELNVAEIAAQSVGLSGLKVSELDMASFVTIALVMTVGILGGVLCCIFFLKKYLKKIGSAPKKESNGKPGFGASATTAMFVGLCAAYIGSYIGKVTTLVIVVGVILLVPLQPVLNSEVLAPAFNNVVPALHFCSGSHQSDKLIVITKWRIGITYCICSI